MDTRWTPQPDTTLIISIHSTFTAATAVAEAAAAEI